MTDAHITVCDSTRECDTHYGNSFSGPLREGVAEPVAYSTNVNATKVLLTECNSKFNYSVTFLCVCCLAD